jgi:hypothetical protein
MFDADGNPDYDKMAAEYNAVPLPLKNTPAEQTRRAVLERWQRAIKERTGRLVRLESLRWQTTPSARKRRPRKTDNT